MLSRLSEANEARVELSRRTSVRLAPVLNPSLFRLSSTAGRQLNLARPSVRHVVRMRRGGRCLVGRTNVESSMGRKKLVFCIS